MPLSTRTPGPVQGRLRDEIREQPEWLTPIAAIVPAQLHAMHLALARGLEPEQPRGLRKVTETR